MPELLLLSALVIDSEEALQTEIATTDNVATPEKHATGVQPGQTDMPRPIDAVLDSVFVQREVQPEMTSDVNLMTIFRNQLSNIRSNLGHPTETEPGEETTDGIQDDDGHVIDFTVTGDIPESGDENRDQPQIPAPAPAENSPSTAETIRIPVTSAPIRDFVENEILYLGSFGHLFLLGEGAPKEITSSRAQVLHMLDQHDGRFARSSPIIFTLFNQLQRGATARQVSLRVRGNHILMKKFAKTVNAPGFEDKLESAIQNPNSRESKKLISLITDLVSISGATIPYSQMERESAYPRILAMKRHFGAFSFFVTISPADMDSILTMRLSNMDTECDDLNIPLVLPDNYSRLKLLSKNSMAAACIYQRIIELFFRELIGLSPNHLTRSSHPMMDQRTEGTLGIPIAYASVTEFQSRGSPHTHFLLVTDISPITIQKYIDNPEFMERFSARMDSMIKCFLPQDVLEQPKVMSTLPVEEETPLYRDHRIPVPADSILKIKEFGAHVARACNDHSHSATCHKGNFGNNACRMAMPRGCSNDPTCCLQLELTGENDNGTAQVSALRHIEPRDTTYDEEPLMKRYDTRHIVVEPHRPGPLPEPEESNSSSSDLKYRADCKQGPNGNIVTHSPVIAACLRCNTNVEPLGNASQEKCSTFYTINYMTKAAYKLGSVLSLIKSAKRHITMYPSLAEDTGTYMRNAQHLLTRILNMQYGSAEVSCQAAVLALRGFPSNLYSHDFFYCFIRPAIAMIRREIDPETAPAETTAPVENATVAVTREESIDLRRDVFIDRDIEEDINAQDDDDLEYDESRQIITDDDGTIRTLGQHEHYMYRGDALKDFSFYEYCSIINITKKQVKKQPITGSQPPEGPALPAGRNGNATFEFSSEHPMKATHVQQLRSKQRVPILAGPPPPQHPGSSQNSKKWKLAAEKFAEYAIILHYPWNLTTHAPDISLTYAALTQWVATLEQSPYFEDKCRLFWLENLAQGMKVDTETLKVMSAWRFRCARVWSSADNMMHLANEKVTEKVSCPGLSRELEEEADWEQMLLDPDCEQSKSAKSATAIADHLTSLSLESGFTANSGQTESARLDEGPSDDFQKVFSKITKKSAEDGEEEEGQEEDASEDESDNVILRDVEAPDDEIPVVEVPEVEIAQDLIDRAFTNTTVRSIQDRVPTSPIAELNKTQNEVLVRVSEWFNRTYAEINGHLLANNGLLLMLSGAAGTGKSFLVQKLVSRLGEDRIRCVSFQGLAASLLPGGRTIHSAFAISTSATDYHINSKACRCARQMFGDAVLLVIDEISNTSSKLLLAIDKRLRQWFDRKKPFGGIGVIAMGDMYQMPPVKGESLVVASNIPGSQAGELFNLFQIVHLTRQMRASDENHRRQLDFFRDPKSSMKPVKSSGILDSIKTLTAEDFKADPEWHEATLIVQDNVTRIMLNRSQAFIFARKHACPVISWRHTLTPKTKQAVLKSANGDTERLDSILDSMPDMTFYFVKGAPAIMKDNMWTSEGLCNGRLCTLHSLTLVGPTAAECWARIDRAGPGEEVMLPSPPKFLNIELEDSSQELEKLSVIPGRTVIPFMIRNKSARKVHNAKKTGSFQRGSFGQAKLSYFDFGVDLAFAVTYHKVQGRTLNRVIIDLNSVQYLTVASIYVSISRTRKQDHIRFLNQSGGIISKRKLLLKEFNRDLVKWIATKTSDRKLLEMISKWKTGDPDAANDVSKAPARVNEDQKDESEDDDDSGRIGIRNRSEGKDIVINVM